MKTCTLFLTLAAACIASAVAGSVEYERCGGTPGVGTVVDVRINSCEGSTCNLTPGTPYTGECDFIPSSAASSLKLHVSVFYFTDIVILDVELENSPVQPGQQYTVRYVVTPNDVLSGNILRLTSRVSHGNRDILEVCVGTQIRIL